MKIFLSSIYLLFFISVYGIEKDLGVVIVGKSYNLQIELSSLKDNMNAYRFVKDCDCIQEIQLKDNKLHAKIKIENHSDFFPKNIFLFNKENSAKRITIEINGEIEKILPNIQYFYSSNCKTCRDVKHFLIEFCNDNEYYLEEHDIKEERNLLKLLSFFENNENISTNVVLFSTEDKKLNILNGKEQIYQSLSSNKKLDVISFESNNVTNNDYENNLDLLLVVSAGLLDGINPCAFATIIFFVALLSVNKIQNRRIIRIGFMFIIGIFLTNFLIGIGLLHTITFIGKFNLLKDILNIAIIITLTAVISLNVLDIYRYKKGKKIINQLSDNTKKKIHKILRKSMKSTYLEIGILVIGVQVALLESVCTGQIYLPLLKVILKEDVYNFSALVSLFVYNFMFILPLIVIFIMILFGKESTIMKKMSQKYFIQTKILMIFLFIAFIYIIIETTF